MIEGYLIGVVVSLMITIIATIVTAKLQGEITLSDLLVLVLMVIGSWIGVFIFIISGICIFFEKMDSITIWKRKK